MESIFKILVSGVLHHENKKYIEEFVENLNSQTSDSFDLLIINEQIDSSKIYSKFKKGKIFEQLSVNLSPKENRDLMFESIRNLNYDVTILTDFDDLMCKNRVMKSSFKILYNKIDLVYNDIIPFVNISNINENKYWNKRADFENQIPNVLYNVFGLGNTAISKKIANQKVKIYNENIYDWEYFLKIYKVVDIKIDKADCITYYRQCNNTLGLNTPNLDIKKLINKKLAVLNNIKHLYSDAKKEICKLKEMIDKKHFFNKKRKKYYWFEQTILNDDKF